ncbi:Glycosyltransferase, GT2 family [Hymenobacter daecheongensis DSM 21074]|uniref:Glycosyltransferase, GT2 family n=1 Tax=Hymenobacter daecheongensis DSM 21074 TaxID=1121955 RepID=A0A1M6EKG4_9BACT|nr:glycosyltransferase family A protein [Hymenobacter daecheongensis]SHI85768.1 Glycosyltransferase, GT2 family [Hymenobacter daecheongensis DSM 21074]
MKKGLSVLIPVYNRDVTVLVSTLLEQAADWGGPVEILCLDDGSSPEFRELNRLLAVWPLVCYQELPHNVGRAAIRNRLAAAAHHEWLLLLDNDSLLPDDQFVARYAAARPLAPVLVGGTLYEFSPPTDPRLYLRWHYGRHREARRAAVRQPTPHAQLTLNNILIQAEVFRRFGLDEDLTRYGHEDTKFGWRLREAGTIVRHLDNPVLHDGLEPAEDFLRKTHEAVRNLALLYRAEGLGTETRLLRTALQLRKNGLGWLARPALAALEPTLRRNLLSATPSLRQLDLLKLSWLLRELGQG